MKKLKIFITFVAITKVFVVMLEAKEVSIAAVVSELINKPTEQVEVKYVPEVIVEAKWGKGPGEFGYKIHEHKGEDNKIYKIVIGPSCLAVDYKGEIYIFDLINKRVNVYSETGKFIRDINLEFVHDDVFPFDNLSFSEIHVDKRGYIYIRYRTDIFSWFIFDKNGRFVKRIVEKRHFYDGIVFLKRRIKELERGENLDRYYREYPDRIKSCIESLKAKLKEYEEFSKKEKVVFLDYDDLKIDDDWNMYLGEYQINSGKIKKVSTKEIKAETLSDRYNKVSKYMSDRPLEGEIDRTTKLYKGGDKYITADGTIYELVRSYDGEDFSPVVKIVKWRPKR